MFSVEFTFTDVNPPPKNDEHLMNKLMNEMMNKTFSFDTLPKNSVSELMNKLMNVGPI